MVNDYTFGKNWANPKDPRAMDDITPTFITAQTLPPVPVNDTFYCKSLSAVAANLVRIGHMFRDAKKIGSTPEERRLTALYGIGVGAPGLFLNLYGSEKFPGGQVTEFRNDVICQAFNSNNFKLAKADIEFFESHPPTDDKDNVNKLQEIYQAGLDIYRAYGKCQIAAKRELPSNGIQDMVSFLNKFPAQLSERTAPLDRHQSRAEERKVTQLNAFKTRQKTEAWGKPQSYRTHIKEFTFVDTKKVIN